MKDPERVFGQHYLVEYIGCDAGVLEYVDDVKPLLLEAARLSRATVLETAFKQFEPVGVTGILLIAESHFSLHTWPEDRYAGFDILTCGDMDAEKAVDYLAEKLSAQDVRRRVISRGF